jgi:hypothetical protein
MNNPLDTATICTLFYPFLGQTRIEDNITCAHWDSLSSKQKRKPRKKKRKENENIGYRHDTRASFQLMRPFDRSLKLPLHVILYDLLPQTNLVWLQCGIQLPLENIPATG